MPKFTTTQNGQEIEVEIPEETVAEWGYLPKADVQSKYVPKDNASAQLKSALASQAETLRQKFGEDPDFVREILEAQGLPLDEEGKVALPEGGITSEELQKRVNEARTSWEQQYHAKHVAPKEAKLSESQKALERMRDQIVVSHIIQTAKDAGVDEKLFKTLPGAPQNTAQIIAQTRHLFDWNPEINGPALVASRDSEGKPQFELNPDAENGSPYADGHYLFGTKFKQNRDISAMLYPKNQPTNTGLGNTNGRATGGKTWSRGQFDAASAGERMAFFKDGGQLQD